MKRINLSQLMARAWRIYRKTQGVTFGEALHRSWLAAKAEPIKKIQKVVLFLLNVFLKLDKMDVQREYNIHQKGRSAT